MTQELFSTIDSSFRVCLDELALIEIREHELDKIYKDLMEDGNEIVRSSSDSRRAGEGVTDS